MVKLTLELSFEDAQRVLELLAGAEPSVVQAQAKAMLDPLKPADAESAPKKRGRPPKAEPAPAIPVEVPVAPAPEVAPVVQAKAEPVAEITGDMVRAALVKYSGSGHGIIGVRKLLQPLGYEKISEIQPKDYAKVIEATKA